MAQAAAKTKINEAGVITVKPVTRIRVTIPDVPGALARIAEGLAEAGVSIEGMGQTEGVNTGFVVDKVAVAEKVLKDQGLEFTADKILEFRCSADRLGVIATIAHKLGDEGINIVSIFLSSAGRGNSAAMYFAVESAAFDKALEVAKQIK